MPGRCPWLPRGLGWNAAKPAAASHWPHDHQDPMNSSAHRILLQGDLSDWRRPLPVTISRPGPDLNPHEPDLRKPAQPGPRWTLSHEISTGQAMLVMCPRGDLNPGTREISPVWGNFHGSRITARCRGRYAFRVRGRCPDGAAGRGLGLAAREAGAQEFRSASARPCGHALRSQGRRNIRRSGVLTGCEVGRSGPHRTG